MDLPYSQQQQARRKNRSAANLQHLTLAPLMPRLPLHEDYDSNDIIESRTYFSTSVTRGSLASGNIGSLAHTPPSFQGRPGPTNSRMLSRSSTASRSHSRDDERHAYFVGTGGSRTPGGMGNGGRSHASALIKSLSATHLPHATDSSDTRQHRRRKTDNHDRDGGGDDWLFRAAVLMTNESRESKGQSWLAARASSTSLKSLRNTEVIDDVAIFEREQVRGSDYHDRFPSNSCRSSRRSSLDHSDTTPLVRHCRDINPAASRIGSRMGSRANSRLGSRIQLFTPIDVRRHSLDYIGNGDTSGPLFAAAVYQNSGNLAREEDASCGPSGLMTPVGPDFVNLDEKLEAVGFHVREESLEDEDQIRRLVKREKAGGIMGTWLSSVFGWSLFDVQEAEGDAETVDDDSEIAGQDEESDFGGEEEDEAHGSGIRASDDGGASVAGPAGGKRRRLIKRSLAVDCSQRDVTWATSRRQFAGDDGNAAKDVPPPPLHDEGTWKDAAWLLSVASKVIL
ncbi:hypothetical protein SEPCBS57363_005886 [Sporothrix epigloea]|uniref:Uncharacterized protein n=1 Tax=Sporothrix epigloea TaxID=1892477 RepID=A0ABP0E3H9_9PEZI